MKDKDLYSFAMNDFVKVSGSHSLSLSKGGYSIPRIYSAKLNSSGNYTIKNDKTGYVIASYVDFKDHSKAQLVADLITIGQVLPSNSKKMYEQLTELKRITSKLLYSKLSVFSYDVLFQYAVKMLDYDEKLDNPVYNKHVITQKYLDIEENNLSYKSIKNKSRFLITMLSKYPKIDYVLEQK